MYYEEYLERPEPDFRDFTINDQEEHMIFLFENEFKNLTAHQESKLKDEIHYSADQIMKMKVSEDDEFERLDILLFEMKEANHVPF